MTRRALIGTLVFAAVSLPWLGDARASDESKYPQMHGQWQRTGGIGWNPETPMGRAEGAPLKPEYQAILEASLADQAAGGQGNDATSTCIPPGMPRAMQVVWPMEMVVTADTTYMIFEYNSLVRRIYTDGRAWPAQMEPAFAGYSIGRWVDGDGSGSYNLLEVESRGFKGPRAFDASGIPLHEDNQTIVKERIYLDSNNRDLLHDEVTTIDHALTRPWTVLKTYRRESHPIWFDYNCAEGNHHLRLGAENYYLSEDGSIWPTRKGQQPPRLRYFDQKAN